jgi:hypothetical protein
VKLNINPPKALFVEMPVPKVNTKLLEELEDIGFPRPRATRALHYSGQSILILDRVYLQTPIY